MSEEDMIGLAVKIVVAEETARRITQSLATAVTVNVQSPPNLSTHVVELSDLTVRGQYSILSLNKPGRLKELIVRSPSPNFTIIMAWDGKTIMKSYKDLEDISQITKLIAAFSEDGKYIVNMLGISWNESITITLMANVEPITFEKIICTYESSL